MTGGSNGRIILVDGERFVRLAVSIWLKSKNYDVVETDSVAEAIEAVRGGGFDLIVTAIMMRPMDGFMFREAVRSFNSEIPFVFLTALVSSASNQLLFRVISDENSCYVAKNARHEYLLRVIGRGVRHHRLRSEVSRMQESFRLTLDKSSVIQKALLPDWSNCETNIGYGCFWRPMEVVSGDLFLWLPQGEDSAVFALCDVVGHGVPAALAMSAIIAHLKLFCTTNGADVYKPDVVCAEIDRFIRRSFSGVTYLTGTIGYLDVRTRVLRYCNAGGPEPLCFRWGDGSRVELNPKGLGCLPMGLLNDSRYCESDVVESMLPADAIVVAHSDGFTDLSQNESGDRPLGQDALANLLKGLICESDGASGLAAVPYKLCWLLRSTGYEYPQDDMTMLIFGTTFRNQDRYLAQVRMDDSHEIDATVARAGVWARAHGMSEIAAVKLELVLGEHLMNVRQHGIHEDRRAREVVLIEIRPVEDGNFETVVLDRGEMWEENDSEMMSPDLTFERQNEMLADNGRGQAILRKICGKISYETFSGLNRVTFKIGGKA